MKHLLKLSLILLAFLLPATAVANPITLQQAQQNVLSFLESKGKSISSSSLRQAQLRSTSSVTESYYVFNIGSNEGYVIAAGDDCAPAILGYADAGYIDVDSMPVNLQSWLEEYAQQIQFMQKNGFASFKASKLTSSYAVIPPLMTTTWDQLDPYNQNCPDFFSDEKCVTGCVATAMAQVMYYHRANSVTQTTAQIPAYDCRTLWLNGSDTLGHIHVDAIPAGSPIDWNNMLDSYSGSSTTAQQQAVANLMKYCGASVEMNYANAWSGGSGAYSTDVPTALKAYFNYSSETVLKNRSDYSSNDAWENLIYNELSNSRPVYYSGRNSSGGHAFVCDGYDGSGYYHINWGWSGSSDGYFLLTALDPDQQGTGGSSSGYNQNQAALINAAPKSSSPTNPILVTSISLNKTSAELNTGETLQLTATVLPSNATNKAVTWTTSNSSVATVSSTGLVTAKAVGNATITARTTDGSNVSGSCYITVKQNTILATSIELNETSAEMTEGNTLQLTATVLPSNATNKTVTWTTSNSSVATVSYNGLVTAKSVGNATITARTTDGSNLSASCSVTVSQRSVLATSISLNKTSAEINTGETLQLTAAVLPSNATNKIVTWTSSNSSIASVNSNGLVTANATGSAIITATTTDGSNLRATCVITVYNNGQSLQTGEWICSNIYQATNDHFFVRMDYADNGVLKTFDNVVSFKGGSTQLVWIYLDDDEIYLNEKVQALPPIPYDNKGNLYKEITYNSFETDIYLPESIEMVQFVDEEGERFDWQKGNRMPNTAQFKFSEGEPKVIDGLNYRSYKLLCFNMSEFGSHFSSKTAKAYENNGALKKDASLFGIYLQNNNQEMAEGRLDQDMIIGNTLLMTREAENAGWEPNDAVFFYGTGGNYESQVFRLYNRVALYGSNGIDNVYAGGIYLNTTYKNLDVNETFQLTATVTPDNTTNKAVTWKSSNVNVATVDNNGNVIAIYPGTATITATTTDGSNLSASCSVTVKQNTVLATSIELNETSAELTEGNTMQLTATVLPSNATYKTVTWTTSNSSVATVSSDGLVTAKATGSATITANTTDGTDLSAYCSVTVKQNTQNNIISFADANVKALCVRNWDTNGDGELSTSEAAAVTSLGKVFRYNESITSFDELQYFTGLTIIGDEAFWGCSRLTSITIPSSVTSIGDEAFWGCSRLTSITIPSSVTSIGDEAFWGCSRLTSITIPSSVTSIGNWAFYGCSGLTSFTIPSSVTSIGNYAFYNCSGLTSITIPSSVTSIGNSAFSGCSGLTSITIPSSVTSIGNYAFECCSGLTSFTIPSSVTRIGDNAFMNCSGLANITVDSNNTVFDSRNNCNAIIEKSNNQLVVGCKNTIIPSSVTSIGNGAFEGCSGLTSITIPSSVTSIGNSVFYGCSGLTSFTIPSSVTSIGDNAFMNCSGLTSFTIPSSVTSIGNSAFSGCSGLNDVYSYISNPSQITMGYSVFYRYPNNYAVRTLHVPAGSLAVYQADQNWSQYFGSIVEMSILATSIELNETSAGMTEGNTLQLTATVLPSNAANKTVTWSTSNSSVATVSSNGLVTAKSPGTATITATTTDGSNLSASCVVTVTEDLSDYDNYLSMDDLEAFHGDTIVIPVKMTNAVSIISFQTDIFLPEGLELLEEDGEYIIDPSERMTRTHSIMSNDVSNGAIRVLCYSSNYKPFTGNSGDDLFYITVKVADDAEGDYTIQLKNTLLTNTDFVDLAAPDVSANVNVKAYLLGDANNSGAVSITDVVVTAQYVLELNPQPFVYEAADVNVDGNITVADVSRIAWMVLNPTLNAPRRAPALWNNGDRMSAEDITLTTGETRRVSILLDNDMDYSAFQLDLNLPEGLAASNFQLTDRAGGHAFDVNTLQNGNIRALCYSPALTVINGHEGALLTFDVTAVGDVNGDILVDGIELVTAGCQSVKLDAFAIGVNNASSVNEPITGKTIAKVEYFNLAGQRMEEPSAGVTLIVTTYTDGSRATSKVFN